MTDEQKELERKAEARKRQLANLKVFKPYAELTDEEREEQHSLAVKGGIARGEQVKKAKSMKEQAITLLETKLSREQAQLMIGDSVELIDDKDLTVQSVLLMSAIREVTENGNAKMLEFLRDTSGQKPKDELTIDANVMTDQDKRLLDKALKRQNIVDVG